MQLRYYDRHLYDWRDWIIGCFRCIPCLKAADMRRLTKHNESVARVLSTLELGNETEIAVHLVRGVPGGVKVNKHPLQIGCQVIHI